LGSLADGKFGIERWDGEKGVPLEPGHPGIDAG